MAYADFWSQYEYDPRQMQVPINPDPDPAPSPGTPPPPDPGVPSGGGNIKDFLGLEAGGFGGDGGDFPSFGGRSRLTYDIPGAPRFRAPTFKSPTLEDAQNEPGYAFARNEGQRALESSAAAKGTLNTGGTLKNVLAWGNKFAEQNYGNVYNRALSAFDRLYQGELDMYKPLLTEWQTRTAGNMRAADQAWAREMDLYRAQIERWMHLTPNATAVMQAELQD
jgi:hypothetical protein